MAVCSNCHAEQPSSEVTSCIFCGYPVTEETDAGMTRADDESLDFEVREASGIDQEFVGGQNLGAGPSDNDLGIETTTDLMQQEAQRETASIEPGTGTFKQEPKLIGDSAPPPPPVPVWKAPEPAPEKDQSCDETPAETADECGNKMHKLSDEDIKNIERNLYGSNSHLMDMEKQNLPKKIGSLPPQASTTNKSGSVSDEQTLTERQSPTVLRDGKPRMAKRGAGLAYFYKSFIQLTGNPLLGTNDRLKVNDREYVLKPKKIKPAYVVGGVAAVFAVFLIILASALSTDTDLGQGQLVGVVLDEFDRPYLQGATIRLPELDKATESDQRGFFEVGALPVGTYRIEYRNGDELLGVDQASITGGQIRMLLLRPGAEVYEEEIVEAEIVKQAAVVRAEAAPPQTRSTPVQKAENPSTAPTKTAPKPTSTQSKKSSPSKIRLDANVDNARFELDGQVLGAGNLTYSGIKSGKHRYKVSASGYQAAEGQITLEPGQTRRLEVSLTPMKQSEKATVYQTEDYFYSGQTAHQQGDYQTAVADLSQAIEAKPSHADAYALRADTYGHLRDFRRAYDDYIRAAEIYHMRKDYGQAIACYGKGIEIDDKTITAYLGRGNLFLKKGETLAAIADFDKAKQLDKRSFQAYYGLGEARFKQQQYKTAIDHFKDARSVNDKDPAVYQYLMLSYLALADYKNVKKSFDKFADVATDEQMARFKSDQDFAAVVRVVESQ